ncbi:hypothetical protein Tco_0896214 [Tanacetum coccineum]
MGNVNPPPTSYRPILPAALRAQAVQELHELQRISAFVNSRLESIEQFLNNFANRPNKTNMDDLESDYESVKGGFQLERLAQGLEAGSIRCIQGIGYSVLEFLGVEGLIEIFRARNSQSMTSPEWTPFSNTPNLQFFFSNEISSEVEDCPLVLLGLLFIV